MTPPRTRIKFCGMTRAEDVRLAVDLGVDLIGLVFAARSPRRLAIAQAQALRVLVPPGIGVVALVMDTPRKDVEGVVAALRPEWVIGVGGFAEARAAEALHSIGIHIGRVLHPSPASPVANRGWAEAATRQLVAQGVWD